MAVRETRAQIAAIEGAQEDGDVREWRAKYLGRDGDPLESWADVKSWPVDVAGSDSYGKGPGAWRIGLGAPRFGPQGKPTVSRSINIVTNKHKAFQTGKELSAELSSRYGWTEATAAGWLVGNFPPNIVDPIEIEESGPDDRNPWGMIVMRIPGELPPSAVAELYASRREEAIRGLPSLENKPIGAKALRATLHAIECRARLFTWDQTFKAWQEKVQRGDFDPDWKFESLESYMAPARRTYKRLFGRTLTWSRKRGERRES